MSHFQELLGYMMSNMGVHIEPSIHPPDHALYTYTHTHTHQIMRVLLQPLSDMLQARAYVLIRDAQGGAPVLATAPSRD